MAEASVGTPVLGIPVTREESWSLEPNFLRPAFLFLTSNCFSVPTQAWSGESQAPTAALMKGYVQKYLRGRRGFVRGVYHPLPRNVTGFRGSASLLCRANDGQPQNSERPRLVSGLYLLLAHMAETSAGTPVLSIPVTREESWSLAPNFLRPAFFIEEFTKNKFAAGGRCRCCLEKLKSSGQ